MAPRYHLLFMAGLALALSAAQSQGQYTFRLLSAEGYQESWIQTTAGATSGGYVKPSSDVIHAALWHGQTTTVTDLNPPSYTTSQIYDVVEGQQVGTAQKAEGGEGAGMWSGTASSFVLLHPAGYDFSRARGTSGAQQVGDGYIGSENAYHALLWSGSPGSVIDLSPAGSKNSTAYAVAAGQQVGDADDQAMIWTGSAASHLNVHPAGYVVSRLVNTNGRQQVGFAVTPELRHHAMLWSSSAEGVVDLHPDGFDISYAWGMNESQQVGHGDLAGASHALVWSGTKESVIDLHHFVPPEFKWSGAADIDAAGNIYGTVAGLAGNETVSFPAVWLVPEPTTVWLLPLALAMCLRRRALD